MAKDPIPIPEPDVVRPPTPSEAPTPDVVNFPEPAPDWEPSPLPSIIPPGFPEEAPKEAPPAGRGRPAQWERRRPRRRGYPAVEGAPAAHDRLKSAIPAPRCDASTRARRYVPSPMIRIAVTAEARGPPR